MWLAVQSPEHKQYPQQAASVQTSELFGVPAVFEVLHSLLLNDESSFCNDGTRMTVSVWPWNAAGIMRYEDPQYVPGAYHTSTDGTLHYIWYYCTRTEVRSLPMILGRAFYVICSGFLVEPRTSSTNENECKRVACHIASRPYLLHTFP